MQRRLLTAAARFAELVDVVVEPAGCGQTGPGPLCQGLQGPGHRGRDGRERRSGLRRLQLPAQRLRSRRHDAVRQRRLWPRGGHGGHLRHGDGAAAPQRGGLASSPRGPAAGRGTRGADAAGSPAAVATASGEGKADKGRAGSDLDDGGARLGRPHDVEVTFADSDLDDGGARLCRPHDVEAKCFEHDAGIDAAACALMVASVFSTTGLEHSRCGCQEEEEEA